MINRRCFIHRGVQAGAGAALGILGRSAFAAAKVESAGPSPVVETSFGKIRGAQQGKIYTFKGVPYGASTAGPNRFMPPRKPAPWTGVRDCLQFGPRAPQLASHVVAEWSVLDRAEPAGEDCLVLNIWTPGLDNRRRPVMFWIHGGGFAEGSDAFLAYDGTELARKHDVVVVGINHRLNAFGYLYLAGLGDPRFAESSNVGMLDIVAALEWVRDHISAFGGDPGSVTIFGQSGGGRKVSTLLGMPAAKGLFHRAIIQSGSQLTGMTREAGTKSAENLLQRLNLKPNQLDELQKVRFHHILDAMQAASGGRGGMALGGGLNFAPVTDGKTLPADPFNPAASPVSADVPLLVGCTETESTWNTNQLYDPLDDDELREQVARSLRVDQDAAAKVISVYKKNQPNQSNLDIFLILTSDAGARTAAITQAERKAALNRAPVYMYLFAWRSPVRDGRLRSMHTMDIPFVFETVDVAKVELGSGQDRYALADRMSSAWVAFARTGNPNHKGIPNWPAYDVQRRATMIFNTECKLVNDPSGEELRAIASVRQTATGGLF
jgi:para-nitrobenzyl esterase